MLIKKKARDIFDNLLGRVYAQQNIMLHLHAKALLKNDLYKGGGNRIAS